MGSEGRMITWNAGKDFLKGDLDDHNAHQKHNPEGNFKPSVEEFGI